MNTDSKASSSIVPRMQPSGPASIARLLSAHAILDVAVPILIGLATGLLLLATAISRSQWAGVALLIPIGLAVVLLAKSWRRLLLIMLVVDIPLGLDVGLGNRLEHNGGPSGFIISLMTLALAAGALLLLTQKRAAQGTSHHAHWDITLPAVLYVFAMMLSTLQATDIWFSLTELFLELQFLFLYLFIASQVKTWADVRLIFKTLVICLLLESVLILAQFMTGFGFTFLGIRLPALGQSTAIGVARLSGTLGHPNVAATFLTTCLVITLGAFFSRNRLVDRRLAIIAFLLGTAALVTTQSRAAWLIFAALIPLLTIYAQRRGIAKHAIWLLCLFAVLVAAAFSSQIMQRLTMDDRGSAESRIWQTSMALNILNQHAFTGIGLNNLWETMPKYLPLEMAGNENVIHDRYLTVWVESGLFGVLTFIWMFIAAIIRGARSIGNTKDPYASIAVASLLAALLVSLMHMFVATFNERPRLELIWLMLAMIVATTNIAKATATQLDPLSQSTPDGELPETES